MCFESFYRFLKDFCENVIVSKLALYKHACNCVTRLHDSAEHYCFTEYMQSIGLNPKFDTQNILRLVRTTLDEVNDGQVCTSG